MTRIPVEKLRENDKLQQVFFTEDKQLRTNRNGTLYLLLRLGDATGSIVGMYWNCTEEVAEKFEAGDYIHLHGTIQLYNNNLQLIATKVKKVDPESIDENEFRTISPVDPTSLIANLTEKFQGLTNDHLRDLGLTFLADTEFVRQFSLAPAGIKNHHAYPGGLLEHVVQLANLIESVVSHYPQLNAELLFTGAFLHDIGKIEELQYERQLGYSDEGQLLGHIVLAISILDAKIAETEKSTGKPFPKELATQLKHLIVSHHGQYEYGSPKLPMTLEALALHYLDDLDAKIHNFSNLMKEDLNRESNLTSYHPSIGRKLFKSKRSPN
ncbi:MAG: HD domain-containing protein [Pirellulaceae bacterium]|nr:HD domain-containing protein [Pirellulaceae bacterium]